MLETENQKERNWGNVEMGVMDGTKIRRIGSKPV